MYRLSSSSPRATLVDIIILITVWPYVCVRGCCKSKFNNSASLITFENCLGCKKDHSRTDYRKAEKMRPGIWYLILASGYLLITIWSLYFACTMYASV